MAKKETVNVFDVCIGKPNAASVQVLVSVVEEKGAAKIVETINGVKLFQVAGKAFVRPRAIGKDDAIAEGVIAAEPAPAVEAAK